MLQTLGKNYRFLNPLADRKKQRRESEQMKTIGMILTLFLQNSNESFEKAYTLVGE